MKKAMKTTSSSILMMLVSGLGMSGVLMTAQDVSAATITSSNFSLGYGFTGSYGITWNDDETSSFNTSTTIGDFTFLPTVTGTMDTSSGPTFGSRILTSSLGASYVGLSTTFLATVQASYNGPTPGDAAAIPNYQITLEITGISVYGYDWGSAATDFAFSETTAGHASSSPAIATLAGTVVDAASYVQLVWDPTDFAEAGTTSSLRSFTVAGAEAIDGFEIFGRVILDYEVIPEPGSLVIGVVGGLMLWPRRRAVA